ncbi:hypothetical protein [Streptomyces marianii]|uniref:Uncharacterized protein n=1 Tax=Streptomyces marianii TaxID=1817406 RepID=A0A5R9EBJ6_9ACTN|nr:hypothetical protein [Streptomyces marianii]TLQ46229.1 hypothetical protein FEF34_27465 [Streptomyces marianii]
MSWQVSPVASAGEEVPDVEGAVAALDRSVLRIRERLLTGPEGRDLGESARLMRARMLDDGRAAVGRGERWSATVGEIEVTLSPLDESA